MKITDKHILFWGGIFSNFAHSPFSVDGHTFPTNEHFFMYCKALYFGDYDTADEILHADSPKIAKKLGRKVKNFNADKWKEVSRDFMKQGLRLKFSQNPKLIKELIKHPNHSFVEASPFDSIWGIGMNEFHPDSDDESCWRGSNWLGQCLNEIKNEYLKQ